jgi:hypothetical protein
MFWIRGESGFDEMRYDGRTFAGRVRVHLCARVRRMFKYLAKDLSGLGDEFTRRAGDVA